MGSPANQGDCDNLDEVSDKALHLMARGPQEPCMARCLTRDASLSTVTRHKSLSDYDAIGGPLVMLAELPGDVDAATRVAGLKHLIAKKDLVAFPRP